MTARPATLPEWCTFPIDPGDRAAPDSAKKISGFRRIGGEPEKPPFQDFNWYMNLVYQWMQYFDSGLQTAGSLTVLNNQAAAQNLGTLKFEPAQFRSFEVHFGYDVVYSAGEKTSVIKFYAIWNNGGFWTWNQTEPAGEIASGLVFSVAADGQVRYTSDNKTGFVGAIVCYRATGTPAT
jgi:hypothetical protein